MTYVDDAFDADEAAKKARAEAFDLWRAGEMVRQAEAHYNEMMDALRQTKTRAAALLGWCVTLTAASVAAAVQSSDHMIEATVAAVSFFVASTACIKTLYSTPYDPLALSPDMFEQMLIEYPCDTKLKTLNAYLLYARDIINNNAKRVGRDQLWLRRAWRIATLAPVATAGSLLFIGAWRWIGPS